MNVKDYLNKARTIERRIRSRVRQLEELRALAERTTAALSDIPGSRNVHGREDVMTRFIDQENEIKKDLDELMRAKREITNVIKRVPDMDQRTLLEERYICLRTFNEVAKVLRYSPAHTYRIHAEALESVRKILQELD